MAKEKKISLKYYINNRVKPMVINGEDCFPLYVQISYNRKTTQVKVTKPYRLEDAIYLNPAKFDSDEKIENALAILNEDNPYYNLKIIEKLIRHEIRLAGEDYTLKGFGNRVDDIYAINFQTIVDICHFLTVTASRVIEDEGFDSVVSKIDYMSVNHWIGIFEVYYHIKFYRQNIKDFLSPFEVYLVTGYWLLAVLFDDVEGLKGISKNDSKIPTYLWIVGDLKQKFVEKLMDKSMSEIIERNKIYGRKELIDDFPFDVLDAQHYINAIDYVIIKEIG